MEVCTRNTLNRHMIQDPVILRDAAKRCRTNVIADEELTHPEVVHDGDGALEALADVQLYVLVETRPQGAEGRQGWPVVLAYCGGERERERENIQYSPIETQQSEQRH